MADSPLPRRNDKIVAGNVVLEGIEFFAPVRDGTAVTVALVYYAGELQICMQYDSPPHHRGPGRRPDGDLSAKDPHFARHGESSSPG